MSDVDRDLAESKILDLIEERDQWREVAEMFVDCAVKSKGQIIRLNNGCYPLPYGSTNQTDMRSACDAITDAIAAYERLCKESKQ